MPASPACAIVIYGASGDLSKRKLIPAIWEMHREGLFDECSYVVGYSRSPMTDEQYRAECREAISKFARGGLDETLWKKLEPRLHYFQGDYGSADDQAHLTAKLAALEQKTSRQLVVVTIPSLGGYEISDYGY